MKFYTDYPITELGDDPGEYAPVRECSVVAYDGNKYVDILVQGVEKNIKRGYVYTLLAVSDVALREVVSWEE